MRKVDTAGLQKQLTTAIEKQKHDRAIELYLELGRAEPKEPRWPHRRGDLLRKLNRKEETLSAYGRAIELYAAQGFIARAAAMAKIALEVDPSRRDLLEKVEPEAARKLHREQRTNAAPAAEVEAPPRATVVPELVRAADSANDEVRFDDDIAMTVDLSDLELAPTESGAHSLRPAAALAKLPAFPLFSEMPKDALHALLDEAELVRKAHGEQILKAGDPADALFAIVEGAVRVHVPGIEARATLREGDVFGEGALLDHGTRRADVSAEGELVALRIPRSALAAWVARYPAAEGVLFELLSRRLVANLLQTSVVFRGFDPEHRRAVSRLFEVRRARTDTTLIERGKRTDGLYVTLTGQARLIDPPEDAPLVGGTVLGQRALLTRAPSTCTVIAGTEVVLLRLPSAKLAELASEFPDVLAHLSELSADAADVHAEMT